MKKLSGWKISSAECQGLSHRRNGVPCQDKTFCVSQGGVNVIALADGAGSASSSHYGAAAVVGELSAFVALHFDELCGFSCECLRRVVVGKIREIVALEAGKRDCSVKDLSSTLLLVAVKKKRYLSVHVGDGVIGCMERDRLIVLSRPENGEHANETWFTTSKALDSVLRVYVGDASNISGFILMSDGTEPSLYSSSLNALAPAAFNIFYLNAKLDRAEMGVLLDESLANAISRRTTDDCSVALMSRARLKGYGEYRDSQRRMRKRQRRDRREAAK